MRKLKIGFFAAMTTVWSIIAPYIMVSNFESGRTGLTGTLVSFVLILFMVGYNYVCLVSALGSKEQTLK